MLEHLKNNEQLSKIEEDILFEFVLEEMQVGNPRKGLLTKAVLESNGDDDKAKSLYLQYRVESIKKDLQNLEIDPKKIPKEELFVLIENDFQGYKKSSKVFKKIVIAFLILVLIGIVFIIYLFIPQPIKNISKQQSNVQKENTFKEQEPRVKQKLDGIRDSYGNLYKEVISPFTGKIWLDRNLGAQKTCEKYDEEKCFGDYFQWGRGVDGHEKGDSKLTKQLSLTDIPDHQKFILSTRDTRYDWLKVQNNTLWQGYYGENNPCPKGFRVPKAGEFKAELIDNGGNNKHKIYKSFLKLPMAGFRNFDGVINNQGFDGRYWTSSRKAQFSLALSSSNGGERPYIFFFERSNGHSVRCIKDTK